MDGCELFIFSVVVRCVQMLISSCGFLMRIRNNVHSSA